MSVERAAEWVYRTLTENNVNVEQLIGLVNKSFNNMHTGRIDLTDAADWALFISSAALGFTTGTYIDIANTRANPTQITYGRWIGGVLGAGFGAAIAAST